MNTYKQQSRKPKLITAQQRIDQFKRDMQELGYEVKTYRGNGRYSPSVSIEAWPKREAEKEPS